MLSETIATDRPLSTRESELVAWLLAQAGNPAELHGQVPDLRVVQVCGCGCASVDFVVAGRAPARGSGLLQVGPECYWGSRDSGLFAVFLFQREGLLAGLDVYSVDGSATPTALPDIDTLRFHC